MSKGSGVFSGYAALKPHLVHGPGGIQGEVGHLGDQLETSLAGLAFLVVEEWVAPPVAVPNAVMHATPTVVGPVTYKSQPGAVGVGFLVNPAAFTNGARNLTFLGGGTTAQCPTSAVITGKNAAGNPATETVVLTAGSGTGLRGWSSVTSVEFLGGTGVAGTEAIGFGNTFGLSYMPKPRGSMDIISPPTMPPIFPEIQGGYPVGGPGAIDFVHQSYTPAALYVPNGATNNALYYEAVGV